MFSLVDYASSDDDSVSESRELSKSISQTDTQLKSLTKSSHFDEDLFTEISEPNIVQKSPPANHQSILSKCLKFRSKHSMKADFFDENYYLKLELELGSEECPPSVTAAPTAAPITANPRKSQPTTDFDIPEPQFVSAAALIDLCTDFLAVPPAEALSAEGDRPAVPHSLSDGRTELPAQRLLQGGLLTLTEQAALKRHRNIDIGTVPAKAVRMDDLTADRPRDLQPGLSAEEMSKFRSIKEEEPDKNSSRQHQITWLAHKAKEREFELMNRWAENSFSQKESRSKYGF